MPEHVKGKQSPGSYIRASQSKNMMRLLLDGATNTTALAVPVPVVEASLPSMSLTAGSTGFIKTDNFQAVRLFFGGTDAADENVNYQVVLWYPAPIISGADAAAYFPVVVAKGRFVLGATTYTVNDFGATGNLIADTIYDNINATGVCVTSPTGDQPAWIDIDLHNAVGIEVETDRGTAASADVFAQFGESPAPFDGARLTDQWRVLEKSIVKGDTGAAAIPLFVASGTVEMGVVGLVTETITGTGAETLSVGPTASKQAFIVNTKATDLTAGDVWHDTSPDTNIELSSVLAPKIVHLTTAASVGIFQLPTDTQWTAGAITFVCRWRPLTAGSSVVVYG